MQHFLRLAILLLATLTYGAPVASQSFFQKARKQIVYINCGESTKGSGVVVNKLGGILTAKHVVSGAKLDATGVHCTARRGSLASKPFVLRLIHVFPDVDLAYLKSVEAIDPENTVRFCPLTSDYHGQPITVLGFDVRLSDWPVSSEGSISSYKADNSQEGYQEVFRTDALTSKLRSGGGAFLKGTTVLLGVVKSGTPDSATGHISSYDITSVESVETLAQMDSSPSCLDRKFTPNDGNWLCEPLTGRCEHKTVDCVINSDGTPHSFYVKSCQDVID
ncbi:MAG: serine protease [Cyanobacteria bacterium J06626_14]